MRNCIRFVLALMLGLLVASCATPPPTPQPKSIEWGFERNAIRVNLTADRDLNYYDRASHTVVVWVYQLSNPNKFNQLSDDQQGLTKLLEGDASVGDYKREFVEPGKSATLTLDRAEGAKYVGLVVGYFAINKESTTRFVDIPVVQVMQGNMLVSKPARMELNVYLGSRSIEKVGVVPLEGQQPGRR